MELDFEPNKSDSLPYISYTRTILEFKPHKRVQDYLNKTNFPLNYIAKAFKVAQTIFFFLLHHNYCPFKRIGNAVLAQLKGKSHNASLMFW
jgi:hypothetical protein